MTAAAKHYECTVTVEAEFLPDQSECDNPTTPADNHFHPCRSGTGSNNPFETNVSQHFRQIPIHPLVAANPTQLDWLDPITVPRSGVSAHQLDLVPAARS